MAGRTAIMLPTLPAGERFTRPRYSPCRRSDMTQPGEAIDRTEEWAALRAQYLDESGTRPPSSARGLHHLALLSSDVEQTINFYQGLLEFPLTELFENRDYTGS